MPSILVLASTAVRSTATLAKTQKHRDNLARLTCEDGVSIANFLYHNDKSIPFGMLFLYKMNSLARWCSSRPSGLCFAKLPPKALLRKLLCSQSRHLTAYDALLHRLTTKGRLRSQKSSLIIIWFRISYSSENANSNANLMILYVHPMFILSRFFFNTVRDC